MENLFIKNIINQTLFNNSTYLNINDILNYYPDKINVLSFNNIDKEEFEIIDINDNNEKKTQLINNLNNEYKRIIKILEFFIINIDINKILLPYFKLYNYDNTSKYMKTKIKKHSNNNYFDIIKFNLKNNINKDKDFIIATISLMTNINKNDILNNITEYKLAIFYIIIIIINLFDTYLKCINYSINLINHNSNILNQDYTDFIINIDNKFFNIIDDEINIVHHNLIKNSFNKLIDKKKSSISITSSTLIKLKKNSNKNYEIYFN